MKIKTTKLERKKPIRIIYWALIIIFVSLTLLFGRNSFLKMSLKKLETARLQEQVNILKTQNDSLRKENHELRTNPEVIERIARENLGFQKDGEKVYRFLPATKEEETARKKK